MSLSICFKTSSAISKYAISKFDGSCEQANKLPVEELEKLEKSLDEKFTENTDKKYPGFAIFIVAKIFKQNLDRRKFMFSTGDSKGASFSAYLTEDDALAFRVVDDTGETNTLRLTSE